MSGGLLAFQHTEPHRPYSLPGLCPGCGKLFNSEAVPIDHLIAPEQLVIDSIYRLIEYPGALQVVNFAEGKVSGGCEGLLRRPADW